MTHWSRVVGTHCKVCYRPEGRLIRKRSFWKRSFGRRSFGRRRLRSTRLDRDRNQLNVTGGRRIFRVDALDLDGVHSCNEC